MRVLPHSRAVLLRPSSLKIFQTLGNSIADEHSPILFPELYFAAEKRLCVAIWIKNEHFLVKKFTHKKIICIFSCSCSVQVQAKQRNTPVLSINMLSFTA